MRAKKKLIARMAAWAIGVLVLAAVAGVASLTIHYQRHQHQRRQHVDRERQSGEEARAYLADLAKRIDRLPVDGNLASEIESRYFEERRRGEQFVWAMDAGGGFSFGVPRSAFDKLNATYDREVAPLLKDGVFIDRLGFLLSFIDDHGDIQERPSATREHIERSFRARLDRWEPEGSVVLSAPLKNPAGAPLGSLYLKRVPPPERYEQDDRLQVLAATAGVAAVLSGIFLWILLPTWVYVDARERGVRRAPLFAFLTVLSSVVGLLVYLIARPEERRTLTCPGCAREVGDGSFCPHCGRDLTRSFCPACRYPLQAEWAYCPACRAEVRTPPSAGTPVPEAG